MTIARSIRRRLRGAPTAARALVATAALAGLLAACGGSTATSATSATTAPPSTGPATSAAASSSTATVTIKDFMFSPMSLTVKAGTTVTWTNDDVTPHNIKFDKGSIPTSPDISAGGGQQTWSHTFTTAGTYAYICGIHTYMTGTVKVTA